MTEKLPAQLPFCCSTHSAAAACEACEHAHRARWQDGATGFCHRSRCRRRAGSCSFLCCSRCKFEFSCRHNRSDADIAKLLPLPTRAAVLTMCIYLLCMLLCRCGAGDCWRPATERCRRTGCLRAMRSSPQPLQGKAVCLPSWQVLPALLRRGTFCWPAAAEA